MGDTQVFVTPDAMTIEVIDRTSPSLEINIDEKRVTVEGAVRPIVNVSYTGGRGPIWLPGNTYDGTSLAAILAGYIGKAQLAQDLLADIDSTITGLVDARAELASAIQANVENGTRIDDVVSRITQAEGTLELSVAKLNAAEANISNAQVFIDDASVRLSAAEGSISNASNYITTQETILSNEWTVKIQENSDGTACVAGTGLLVYPTWKLDTVYDIDDYSWFDGNAYKAIIAHTASEENVPPNSSYWQLIPYATKSQFGVLAETFFVQTQKDGNTYTPFVIYEDQVVVNGDMVINGLIKANYILANNIATWSLQSHNYESGISGYKLDATTGLAEFNNITLEVNANIMGPNLVPNSNFRNTTTHDWIVYINPTNDNTATISYNPIDSYDTKWRLAFSNVLGLTRIVGSSSFYSYFEIIKNTPIYITPNTKYCYFAYLMSFRCTARVDLIIYDSSNNILQRIYGEALSPDNSNLNNALSLNDWTQSGKIFTTPNETSYCKFVVWSSENTTVTYDVWTQIAYLYLSTLNDTTNTLPSWVIDTVDEYTATTHRALNDTLDTETGGIIVRDGGNRRYAHLTGGDLTFYDYVDSGWIPYKSVTRTVTGVCTNGETVNIGYFHEQPNVIVSPYNIQSYSANSPSQSQVFNLGAANLRKVGNNWFFDTIAQLNLLSGVTTQTGGSNTQTLPSTTGSGVLATTIQTGTTVSVAVIPPNITMPLNTKQVSVSLRLRQQYTFDYVGHNFQVPVAVNIEIQYLSGGGWVTGARTTLTGVNCLYVTERNASLSFSLSTAIGVIRIVATFICYAGSTAQSTSRGTPVYNTMFAEILQITSQQEATTISASGYASYMAIG